MKINRYSIKSLLNLAFIISIFLGVSNSISVKSATNDKPPSENTKSQEKQQSSEPKDPPETFDPNESVKKTTTDDQKTLTIKDSLLFIDLPILATLLLLWFLNQKKQQEQIDRLTKNQNKIISNFSQFNEITNKLNNLDQINRQLIEKLQDSNQRNINLEVKLHELLSKQQFNQSVNYHNSLTLDTSNLNSIAIVDKIVQLAETYNQDKNSLSNKAIATVAETQESLNRRRSGSSDIVTLENTTQKKYCIIEEDSDYYLIPHAKIKIDEYNRTTLESLFDCTNFTSEYSDFQLVKPAKVSQLSSETWQVEEKGKLDFY